MSGTVLVQAYNLLFTTISEGREKGRKMAKAAEERQIREEREHDTLALNASAGHMYDGAGFGGPTASPRIRHAVLGELVVVPHDRDVSIVGIMLHGGQQQGGGAIVTDHRNAEPFRRSSLSSSSTAAAAEFVYSHATYLPRD